MKQIFIFLFFFLSVMSHILAERDHVPLPSVNYHILVEPFYIQFHDCLEQQLLNGEEKLAAHEKIGYNANNIKKSNDELENDLIKPTDQRQNREMDQDDTSDEDVYMDAEINNEEQNEDESSDEEEIEEVSEGDDLKLKERNLDEKWDSRKANKTGEEFRGQSTRKLLRGMSRGRKVFNRDTSEISKKTTDCDQKVIQQPCYTSGRGSAVRGRGKPINKKMFRKIHPTVENTNITQTLKTSGVETENGTSLKDLNLKNPNRRKSSFDDEHRFRCIGSAREFTSSSKGEKNPIGEERSKQMIQSPKDQPSKAFEQKEQVTKIISTFLDSSVGNFDECTVKYDAQQEAFLFEGTEKCVRERHLVLLAELRKIKEDSIELTPSIKEILTTIWKAQCLEKLDNLIKPMRSKLLWENSTLKIFSYGEDNLKSSLEVVKAETRGSHLIDIQGSIKETDFQSIKSFTECKFPVIVTLTKGNILIEGLKEEVTKATKSINGRLVNFLNVTSTFKFSGPQAAYFNKVLKYNIPVILRDVNIVENTVSDTDVRITFCGTTPHVNEALEKLNNIKSAVHCKSWDLFSEFNKKREDMKLVTVSLSKSTLCISKFEKEHGCLVTFNLPKITDVPLPRSQRKQTSARKKTFSQKHNGARCLPRKTMTEQENSPVYNLTDTCQLFLQTSANITQESSTVLVCVLDDKVDLRRTRVGMDFNKSCPTLWKQLNEAREKVSSDTSVLVTNGPFQGLPRSCQAVYHAILSKWSPGSSEAKLALVVKTIVTNAINSNMTSISIPPLGCGKLLGYPSSSVAQIIIQTLRSHVGQSSIKRVVLLGKDPQLMGDYKIEAQKVLLPVTPAFASENRAESEQNLAYNLAVNLNAESSEDFNSMDDSSDEEDENMDPQYEGPGSLTIWTGGKEHFGKQQSLDTLWALLKKNISDHCLHVEYFNQSELQIWPKHFYIQIRSAAKKESVWIENSKNSMTNKASFIAKGEKPAVDKIIKIIDVEFKHLQEKQLKRITSSKYKRGTLEFVRHASKSTELVPSYWNLSKKEEDNPGFIMQILNKFRHTQSKEKRPFLKDVDDKTKAAIVKLVSQDLFDSTRVGQGRDAVNLNHRGIKVVDVKRVENPGLFEPYSTQRTRLFQACCTRQQLCTDIGKIPGSNGRVMTTEKLPDFMKTELYWEVNEHYLFHGTSATETLVTSGPDPRVGSEGGMFGKGFYLAEMTTKADQYAGTYFIICHFLLR